MSHRDSRREGRRIPREILYGRQAVREALRAARRRPYRLLIAEKLERAPIIEETLDLASRTGIPLVSAPRQELDRIGLSDAHQGIALEVSPYPYSDLETMLNLAKERNEPPLLLLLDLIQDTHNLGSLLRSAEAVGVHGVVIQERRAASITPAAVNTSSGAVEHMLIAQVTNLAQTIEQLKRLEIWIAGLDRGREAIALTRADLTLPLAIVVGNEGSGLRRLVRERCDWLIEIPMRGRIESLNAAVAGSLLLYEALRQRERG